MKKIINTKMNIFVKLISMSLLLVIVPLLTSNFIAFTQFSKAVQKDTAANMSNTTEIKLSMLQDSIDNAKITAYSTTSDSTAKGMLSAIANGGESARKEEENNKKEIVGRYLKDINDRSDGTYENLFYVDVSGKILVDAMEGKSVGVDVTAKEYYKAAKQTGKVSVGNIIQSPVTGEPVIVIGVPLYDANIKYIGMFGAAIQFNKLTDMLISGTGEVNYDYGILNEQGLIIAHENKDFIYKLDFTKENETTKKAFETMQKTDKGIVYYTLDGVEKVVSFVKYKEMNIYVLSAYAVNEYMKPINDLQITVYMVLIICIIITGVIAFLFSRSISNPLKSLAEAAKAVAAGDLTHKVEISTSKDEIGQVRSNFADMVDNLRKLVTRMSNMGGSVTAASQEMMASSEEVSKVSEQISLAVADLAKGATEQAASTENGNIKIIEIINGLENITQEMERSNDLADKANKAIEIGQESVRYQNIKMNENIQVAVYTADTISALSSKSIEIGNILEAIKSISDQTNLLALNAAIEAARAGEQGRGFAVVAEEIRKLAEESNMSVKKIDDIIKEVQSGVDAAVQGIDKAKIVVGDQEKALSETVSAFENISKTVLEISSNIKSVADKSGKLNNQAKQAGDDINSVASIAQENAAAAEEVTASTEEQTSVMHQIARSAEDLSNLASQLQDSINKFTI